jgi:hypothetical protein
LGEEDIHRSEENGSEGALMDEWPYDSMESRHNALMFGQRSGCHVMVSINKFMAFSVFGKRQILLIRKF